MKHSAKINHIEWSEYPIGTRANSISGGYWEKTKLGWKWCTGATFHWGQKTLQSQPSAVDRINVRRLMMFMEEAISESSRFVVFEPNHPQTWRALGRLINPFLQDIKDKGGLYDFAFQCDEETNTPAVIDRNEMVARVFVKPTKTAEFIELNFILTSTGADFKEIIDVDEFYNEPD